MRALRVRHLLVARSLVVFSGAPRFARQRPTPADATSHIGGQAAFGQLTVERQP